MIATAFYSLTQGSQLIPYFWFLALEQAKGEALFRSDQHMQQLGYIPQKPDKDRNPDGLPIGFVKDDDPATVDVSYAMKKELLGPNYKRENYPSTHAWLGLTCAACHTREMTYKGQSIRIDGGPALADHESFIEQLAEALHATHSDPQKMTRFAHRVLDPNWSQGEQDALKDSVVAYSGVLNDLVEQNRSDLRYGLGRVRSNSKSDLRNRIGDSRKPTHGQRTRQLSFSLVDSATGLGAVQWFSG